MEQKAAKKLLRFLYYLPLFIVPGYLLLIRLFGFQKIFFLNPLLDLLLFIGFSLFAGRFYCGYLCREGLLQSIPGYISGRITKGKFPMRMKGQWDTPAKGIRYIFLIAILVWSIIHSTLMLDFNYPSRQIEMLMKGLEWISAIILIGSVLISFFISRFYCRYICPIGAIQGLISKIGFWNLSVNQDKCIHCKMCNRKCPASLQIEESPQVTKSECYSCLRCISVCPRNAISVNILKKQLNPYCYVILCFFIFVGLKLIMLWINL